MNKEEIIKIVEEICGDYGVGISIPHVSGPWIVWDLDRSVMTTQKFAQRASETLKRPVFLKGNSFGILYIGE